MAIASYPAAEHRTASRATLVLDPELSRDELVGRYLHLVKYVVGRLGVSVPGLFDHEDAMQAGVLGLLRAIDGYRPEAAASFESYAILRIRGSILDAVRALDTVGRAGREAARAIQGAIRDLQHELGRSPTEAEIADKLDLSLIRYRERLQAVPRSSPCRSTKGSLAKPTMSQPCWPIASGTRMPWIRPRRRRDATPSFRLSTRSDGSANGRAWSSPFTTRTR